MQITFPSYYKKFSCIADACPDTCCAGWQIMIDDKIFRDLSGIVCITISTGKNMPSASTGIAVHF